jgi:hypothetical protein
VLENGLIKDFAQVQSRFGENRDLRSRQIKEFAGTVVLAKKAIDGNAKEFDRKKFKQMMLNLDIFVTESRISIAIEAKDKESFKREVIAIDKSLCALKTELLDLFERASVTKFGKILAEKAESKISGLEEEIERLRQSAKDSGKSKPKAGKADEKLAKELAAAKENVRKKGIEVLQLKKENGELKKEIGESEKLRRQITAKYKEVWRMYNGTSKNYEDLKKVNEELVKQNQDLIDGMSGEMLVDVPQNDEKKKTGKHFGKKKIGVNVMPTDFDGKKK